MRVIFLGTPAFAVGVLDRIARSSHEVVCVVTQPDRECGRGKKVSACPVKVYAEEHGIPTRQYEKINLCVEDLRAFDADIMVTCAYGQILRQQVLDLCKHGIINVHASLLPAYRGSSPVEWALINGEKEVGVTIMQTELGVDTGAMILQRSIKLDGTENAAETLEKLSVLGADLIVEALDLIEKGKAVFTPQDENKATKCRMFVKEDGKLSFEKSAAEVHNFIRGINPRPGAFVFSEQGRIKVLRALPIEYRGGSKAGEIVEADPKKGLIVKCGEGYLKLLQIQGENAKPMSSEDYLRGKKLTVGKVFE